MTKEEKTLLTKVLCEQMPYGVQVSIKDIHSDRAPWHGPLSCKDLDCFIHDVAYEYIKPYLRPMSSMTEDEKQEYINLIVNTGGKRGLGYCLAVTRKRESVEPHPEDSKYSTPPSYHECQDWLNAKHFDYRGLIPMGLAIAAVGKDNPYKEKGGVE